MTDDILLNITEDSFNEGEVELVKTNELFIKPNKSDTKAIKDVLVNAFNNNSLVRKVVVGLYINTEKGENPYYTVGILVDKDFDYYKMETTRLLYTRFAKYASRITSYNVCYTKLLRLRAYFIVILLFLFRTPDS